MCRSELYVECNRAENTLNLTVQYFFRPGSVEVDVELGLPIAATTSYVQQLFDAAFDEDTARLDLVPDTYVEVTADEAGWLTTKC